MRVLMCVEGRSNVDSEPVLMQIGLRGDLGVGEEPRGDVIGLRMILIVILFYFFFCTHTDQTRL